MQIIQIIAVEKGWRARYQHDPDNRFTVEDLDVACWALVEFTNDDDETYRVVVGLCNAGGSALTIAGEDDGFLGYFFEV